VTAATAVAETDAELDELDKVRFSHLALHRLERMFGLEGSVLAEATGLTRCRMLTFALGWAVVRCRSFGVELDRAGSRLRAGPAWVARWRAVALPTASILLWS